MYNVYLEKTYEEGARFVGIYLESQLLGRLGQKDHNHVQEQPRQLSHAVLSTEAGLSLTSGESLPNTQEL